MPCILTRHVPRPVLEILQLKHTEEEKKRKTIKYNVLCFSGLLNSRQRQLIPPPPPPALHVQGKVGHKTELNYVIGKLLDEHFKIKKKSCNFYTLQLPIHNCETMIIPQTIIIPTKSMMAASLLYKHLQEGGHGQVYSC